MVSIPQHIQELKSYKPGKPVSEIIHDLGLSQTAILWNNENNLGIPKGVQYAAQNALSKSNLYPDPLAIELRTKLAKLNGRSVDEIAVGNGSEEVLNNLFRCFCGKEEELLTSEGTFVAVYIWAKSNNVGVQKVPLTKDYKFDIDRILNSITERTKIVYISNPNNPTGTLLTKAEISRLINEVPKDKLLVIDEAYIEYARDLSPEFIDTSQVKQDNLLTLRTFSKAYGLAGIRLGYAIGSPYLIDALQKVKMTFAPSAPTLAAGTAALEDQEFLDKTVLLSSNAVLAFSNLFTQKNIPFAQSAGNFVMIDLGTAEEATQLASELLHKGVFVRVLAAFGLPSCIRISTGTETENQYFLEVFSELA